MARPELLVSAARLDMLVSVILDEKGTASFSDAKLPVGNAAVEDVLVATDGMAFADV
jgi:hypothetical protein